jgi:hypothetical protein
MIHPIKRLRDATTRPLETVRQMNEKMLADILRKLNDMRFALSGVAGLDSLVEFVGIAATLADHDPEFVRAIAQLERANHGQYETVITAIQDVRRIAKLASGFFLESQKMRREGERPGPERIFLRIPAPLSIVQIKAAADEHPETLRHALRYIEQVYVREAEPLIKSLDHVIHAAQPRPLNFRPGFRAAARN